ncbi:ankyrin repeat domain-containing protein [Chitinilyticum litopenaei]|uniref:ankyrin repeat domain-containing protein n=1 Tax=Chitinilyticum litopenaei TaxID=1121276 RepID=UPI00040D1BE2|nr:ankyrin repeat domain-containing protein [Chitinilyticum litopenaei]
MAELKQLLQHAGLAELYPQALADRYPRIAERLVALWGSPELNDYLDELLIMDKPDRMGFPPDIGAELMNLAWGYKLLTQPRDTGDVWDFIPLRESDGAAAGLGASSAHLAVRDDDLARLQHSLAQDPALLDARDEQGWTPLIQAAFSGRVAALLTLLEQGANIGARDRDGYQALHWAALHGHVAVIRHLLVSGVAADVRSLRDNTPLLLAASAGHEAVLRLLLNHGAQPGNSNEEGWTALHKAAANGHVGCVLLLLAAGASPLQTTVYGDTACDLVPPEHDRLAELLAGAIQRQPENAPLAWSPASAVKRLQPAGH